MIFFNLVQVFATSKLLSESISGPEEAARICLCFWKDYSGKVICFLHRSTAAVQNTLVAPWSPTISGIIWSVLQVATEVPASGIRGICIGATFCQARLFVWSVPP
jgi:hypothetical protein